MNSNQVEKQAIRELSLEEVNSVSGGGTEVSCTVTINDKGEKSLSCTVKVK